MVREAGERRQGAELVARRAGDRLRDRMLGRVLERAGHAEHARRAPRPLPPTTSTRLMRPVVTVPVLSSTIVSTVRVDSRISGPLISSPSCAPRPVPTSSAVGVARPSAHGQAMISTATAAVNANSTLSPAPIQKPSVATASPITTGTNTPETRSASRCTGALPDCASVTSRAIWASAVSAPTLRRAHDQAAAGVHGRARDLVARPLLDRHRLAGEQRLVDGAGAFLDDAVGRDLLAGADDEAVADAQLLDRHAALGAVGREHRDVLGAELEQGGRAPPRRGAWRAPRSSGRRG